MNSLYSLIQRSIIDRGLTSAADREEVYKQARTAVIRELWSYEPPLSEEEIEARIGQFDIAIDRLEGDLADTFAEPIEVPPPAPPGRPSKGAVSVFEGYDRDTDYVPAYIAPGRPSEQRLPAIRSEGARAALPRSRREDPALDPLALRLAAIEAALRSSGEDDDLVFEGERRSERHDDSDADGFADHDPFMEPAESAADERPTSWSWEDDARRPDVDEVETYEVPEETRSARFSRRGDADDAPEPVAKRPWTALIADRIADLDERTRVRVLIGAIAALGVVFVLLAAVMLSSLFSRSGGAPQTPAMAAVGSGGDSDETAANAAPADVAQTFTVFDGSDPTVFESGSGNPVRFDKSARFARITSSTSDPGVRVLIGPGLAGRVAGRPVRVTVLARAARENGATGLRFAYENGIAISQWQTANLGGDFTAYNLVWRVPALRVDPNADQLLIEPGIPGDGTAADIQSIKIDVLK